MLNISRTVSNRLLAAAASTQICSVRHKTVPIIRFTPQPPVTNRTMGPFPTTQEEREKAAKKYNLIPEDYEPYPEEDGFGDYPKLPAIGAFNRYKYDDFDDLQDYRFYGEPFHLHADLYYWERIDPMENEKILFKRYPYWLRAIICFLPVCSVIGIMTFCNTFNVTTNFPWKVRAHNEGRPLYAFPVTESAHGHHH